MKISVFGATGVAGTPIVNEALNRGHTVTAWSRRLGERPRHDRLTAGIVDRSSPAALGPIIASADAAVLTIRPARGDEPQLGPWTFGFLDAAALQSPHHPDLLLVDDPDYVHAEWRAVAHASVDQLRACQRHPYTNWVYLGPAATFETGQGTGYYERGTTRLLVNTEGISRITPSDLAIAVIDELESPGQDQHFTVVQTSTPALATA